MGAIGRALSPGLGCPTEVGTRIAAGNAGTVARHAYVPGHHYQGHARADEEALALLLVFVVLFVGFFVFCTTWDHKYMGSANIAQREAERRLRELQTNCLFGKSLPP